MVFFGMVITIEEAAGLLNDAMLMAAMPDERDKRARDFLIGLAEMHASPGREIIRCDTCGQTRTDTVSNPTGREGFVLRPNPAKTKTSHD